MPQVDLTAHLLSTTSENRADCYLQGGEFRQYGLRATAVKDLSQSFSLKDVNVKERDSTYVY